VRDVVGGDPVEFAEAFLSNYPAGSWITRERDRLTRAIEEAERQAAGDDGVPR
jgi:DNA-binding ferritin-like protein (Dps family)